MGGGDVKLFAAVGALSGPLIGLQIQLCAYLVFALYVPASLLYEGRLFSVLGELVAGLRNALRPGRDRKPSPPAWKMSFRLGPAIFLATLATALGYRMY
jgi:prepilin peptidase CpaA